MDSAHFCSMYILWRTNSSVKNVVTWHTFCQTKIACVNLEKAPCHSCSAATLLCCDCLGDPQSFKVTVTPQRDLPLDLYILMDLSSSMNLELETIKIVASSIRKLPP